MVTSVTGLPAACFAASDVARRVRPSRGVRSPTKSRFSICWPFTTTSTLATVPLQGAIDRTPGKGAGDPAPLREARRLERGQDHARRGRLVQRVEVDARRAAVKKFDGLRGGLGDARRRVRRIIGAATLQLR